MKKDFKLKGTIILNGFLDMLDTNDENCGYCLGIKELRNKPTFEGVDIVEDDKFVFSKHTEELIEWTSYFASVSFTICNNEIDSEKLEENIVKSYYGELDTEYMHCYSEITGYLWTDEEFKVGGHDLLEILSCHVGKYIHMEIKLYERRG